MFLSYLLIDTAADAAHPRPGRMWVRNAYRVHQRLCMAFPSGERKKRDEHFLNPFVPDDFPTFVRKEEGHVHHVREEAAGFLFRIDMVDTPHRAAGEKAAEWRRGLGVAAPSRHVVIVQSAIEPDWKYAFLNAREFLCAEPLVKDYTPTFEVGQKYQFRLRANPTKRLTEKSIHCDGKTVEKWHNKKGEGKRVGLCSEDEQGKWLDRRAASCGFRVAEAQAEQDGFACSRKNDHLITLASVRFEGTLEVTDPVAFRASVFAGIGPGKGLGFGLLSVAQI